MDVFRAWDYARTISRSKKLHIACPKVNPGTKNNIFLIFFKIFCQFSKSPPLQKSKKLEKGGGFRAWSPDQDKITSRSPKVFGKSSEGLKCSELSSEKVMWSSDIIEYRFLKNLKNHFLKKWRFPVFFKKFGFSR